MPRLRIDLGAKPFLDIVSYARGGVGLRDRFSAGELGLISRSAHRVPEVMIKVLTKGGRTVGSVQGHLEYIAEGAGRELESDDGQPITDPDDVKRLIEDWDLDLEVRRSRNNLT